MPEDSMTPLTASCSFPPSVVNSFWYSISTTAVLLGSTAWVQAREPTRDTFLALLRLLRFKALVLVVFNFIFIFMFIIKRVHTSSAAGS